MNWYLITGILVVLVVVVVVVMMLNKGKNTATLAANQDKVSAAIAQLPNVRYPDENTAGAGKYQTTKADFEKNCVPFIKQIYSGDGAWLKQIIEDTNKPASPSVNMTEAQAVALTAKYMFSKQAYYPAITTTTP